MIEYSPMDIFFKEYKERKVCGVGKTMHGEYPDGDLFVGKLLLKEVIK